nr:AAA domain-containing protein [Fredinandcohnia onubensis]
MSNQIYLYDDSETFEFVGQLPFACTNSFVTSCIKLGIDRDAFLSQLANQKVFLMIEKESATSSDKVYQVLTDSCIMNCAYDPNGHFVIKHLNAKTVSSQNQFLKYSLKVRTTEGACFWHNSDEWGLYSSRDMAMGHFQGVYPSFSKKISAFATQQQSDHDDEDTDEDFQLSDHLEDLLERAEQYVIAEDEIQKAAAQSGPQISYYEFESASGYERLEKLSYHFLFTDLDKNTYKRGTRVIVHLDHEQEVAGVIVSLEADEKPYRMTILFDEQFDINDLLPMGLITLEYNAVQRLVRENVIQDIRIGQSEATYFDEVVGLNKFSGFTKKPVEALLNQLKSSNRPPNESQLEAIRKGIETNDALLVLGPPGTGKTTVILEWVKYFVLQEKKRVLISSQNNKAVDNVLERLAEEKEIDTIRVGSEEKVQSNVQHLMYEERAKDLQNTIMEANDTYTERAKTIIDDVLQYSEAVSSLLPRAREMKRLFDDVSKKEQVLTSSFDTPLDKLQRNKEHQQRILDEKLAKQEKVQESLTDYEQQSGLKKTLLLPKLLWSKASHQLHVKQVSKQKEVLVDILNEIDDLTKRRGRFLNETLHPLKDSLAEMDKEWTVKQVAIHPLSLSWNNEVYSFTLEGIFAEEALLQLENQHKECQNILSKLNITVQALDRWRSFLQQKKNYALSKVLLESVDLVGATCVGINSQQRFQDLDFDVTIIDEAGQIQIHNAIVPMSRSKKVIMLGDHLQIPPMADQLVIDRCKESGVKTDLLTKSFFEYLYERFDDSNKILLDTQYRMPAEIADLLSEWFYNGEYHSFSKKKEMKSAFPHLFKKPFVIIDTSKMRSRRETKKPKEGSFNKLEAEIIISLLRKMLEGSNETKPYAIEEIGVIAPYKLQVNYIRNRVLQEFPQYTKQEVSDLVATLDSFQGQERPVIMYSCTKSNTISPEKERVGFQRELRRLNVALSRCQEQLVFIGDLPFLTSCEYFETNMFNQPLVDRNGKPIHGTSEKEFSRFIQLMTTYAADGKAELLSAERFIRHTEEEKVR